MKFQFAFCFTTHFNYYSKYVAYIFRTLKMFGLHELNGSPYMYSIYNDYI
jgi:hypothetical protein